MRFATILVLAALSLAPTVPQQGCAYPAVAVVELFTSEGCSSCPPADNLLIEIARDARQAGKAVYPLAYHVDYWDDLGWKDPYSSAAYTRRQSEYEKALNVDAPYTPQMIVNGKMGFVGSRRGSAKWAIEKALERASSCAVRATAKAKSTGEVTVAIDVTGAAPEDRALAALVERDAVHRIGAGENAGKTLHHGEVVRALEAGPVGSGALSLKLHAPPGLGKGKSSIVVFVQKPRTLEITGATRVDL